MKCLSDIFDYAVYKMVYSEEADFSDIDEFIGEYDFNLNLEYVPQLKKRGVLLFNSFYGIKHVWTGIHIETWGRYFQERDERDLFVLLANLAFKSIIQMKPYQNTKDNLLLARMAGNDDTKGEVPEKIREFMKPRSRSRKRLFTELECNFGFKRVARSRGITYSYSLTLRELEFEVRKARYLSKERKEAERKKAERAKAKSDFDKWIKRRKLGDPDED